MCGPGAMTSRPRESGKVVLSLTATFELVFQVRKSETDTVKVEM